MTMLRRISLRLRQVQQAPGRELVVAHVIVAVAVSVFIWAEFVLTTIPTRTSVGGYVLLAIVMALVLVLAVGMAREPVREGTPISLLMVVWLTVNAVVWAFAVVYTAIGTTRDFSASRPLTKLDGLYFALGTLSTAGSGNLSATSDRARAVQIGQFVADLILVLFIIGVMVSRLVASRSKEDEWVEVDRAEESEWV